MKTRKAISAYIAVLFLLGLAVAGGVLIYSNMMGALTGYNTNVLPQTISLDSAKIQNSTACIAYIRNVGSKTITIDKAYINDDPASSVDAVSISPNTVEAVTITGTFVTETSYDFKVVAKDLTQIVFTLKASF